MRRLAKSVVTIVLMLAILVAILAFLLPSLFSGRLAVIYSSSMQPAMPKGSLVMANAADPATIEVGDIIAFHPPDNPDITVSHRVIEVIGGESLSFQTKGDAAGEADSYTVPAENLVGKVAWHIPYVGYPLHEIRQFAHSPWGLFLLIALPAMIVFGSAIRDLNSMYSAGGRRARIQKKREKLLKKRAPGSWRLRRAG